MSISDFESYAIDVGFEILAIIPWTNNEDMFKLSEDIIKQTKINYPRAEPIDLISRGVITILRKPVDKI